MQGELTVNATNDTQFYCYVVEQSTPGEVGISENATLILSIVKGEYTVLHSF